MAVEAGMFQLCLFELMKSSVKWVLFSIYFLFFKGVCCLPLIRLLFLVEHSSKTFIQWSTLLSLPSVCNIFMLYVKYSECIWSHMVCSKDQWLFTYRGLNADGKSLKILIGLCHLCCIQFSVCMCLLQGHKTRPVNVPDGSDAHYQNPWLSHFTLWHWFVREDMKWFASHTRVWHKWHRDKETIPFCF